MAALPLTPQVISPEREAMHVHMRLCTSGSGLQPYVCKSEGGGPLAISFVR